MQQKTTSNHGRGWLLVAAVASLVLLTGIYPLVAEPENRVMAAAIVGVAAIALGVSFGPLRRGEPTAWKVMWLFPAFLTLIAAFITIAGDATFGVVYLVFVATAGLGLWLAHPTDSDGKAETTT